MTAQPVWLTLARHALHEAVRQDYDHAATVLTRLAVEHGNEVIPDVMCAWIDATAAFCDFRQAGHVVGVLWVDEQTSRILTADEVDPADRWAGRLFAAHVSLDNVLFDALLDSVDSSEQWSANVAALLRTCAAELRIRGYRPATYRALEAGLGGDLSHAAVPHQVELTDVSIEQEHTRG